VSGFALQHLRLHFLASQSPVSWSNKKQATMALSSTEAEYMAITQSTTEAIWLRFLSEILDRKILPSIIIFADNQSCIAHAHKPEYHARTKHIQTQHHFIGAKVERGEVTLEYSYGGRQSDKDSA